MEQNFFDKYTPDFPAIIKYGFDEKSDGYYFEKLFFNNDFRAVIAISKEGKVSGKIFDVENDDEYLPLKIKNQIGEFSGKVLEGYKTILEDIRENCFVRHYFKVPQANRIAERIFKKYGDRPLFMWEKFPECGVFKNPKTGKWYGIIMDVERNKLGEESSEEIDVLNLKIAPETIQKLLKRKGFYPAWHMNKKMWITISLDETVNDDEILELTEESHSYTRERNKKS